LDSTPTKIDSAVRAQASALDRLEKVLLPRLEHLDASIASLQKRVATATMAAWLAAGLALVAAIGAIAAFVQ